MRYSHALVRFVVLSFIAFVAKMPAYIHVLVKHPNDHNLVLRQPVEYGVSADEKAPIAGAGVFALCT